MWKDLAVDVGCRYRDIEMLGPVAAQRDSLLVVVQGSRVRWTLFQLAYSTDIYINKSCWKYPA
jgi:hypothetical protein